MFFFMLNDTCDVLRLTMSATADDVKKACRKMSRSSHPDQHLDDTGAVQRFKQYLPPASLEGLAPFEFATRTKMDRHVDRASL